MSRGRPYDAERTQTPQCRLVDRGLVDHDQANTGNLIVGGAALDRYLGGAQGPRLVTQADRAQAYVELAAAAMQGAPPGSSAHGEHPKFAVRSARDNSGVEHALVKFSPARTTPVGARWADLLVAEHVATVMLSEHGIPAAHSELLEYGEQVFLQSQRFDRVGDAGRRGVTSLFSLDTALYGQLDSWLASAWRRLSDDDRLSADFRNQSARALQVIRDLPARATPRAPVSTRV